MDRIRAEVIALPNDVNGDRAVHDIERSTPGRLDQTVGKVKQTAEKVIDKVKATVAKGRPGRGGDRGEASARRGHPTEPAPQHGVGDSIGLDR